MGKIGNIKKSFLHCQIYTAFTFSEDFDPRIQSPDNNAGFILKPALPTKSKRHNGDSKKKCYRRQEIKLGSTYISGGGNIDQAHYKKMRLLTEKFLNCV
ncbi:MAG: hypothetical protein A2Z38_11900 [Planctomycetes bacterium RBG_19FT_COMBO_48_8]|nr:MAG: hypothetical protein A2Z38_11900 [Planctomycetes bacterium RBG_19FT_COMBO_48_8]